MGQTILIVEDDDASSQVASLLLEHDGFHVLTAADAAHAGALARSEQPDLVLIDLRIPAHPGAPALSDTGLELAAMLARDHPDIGRIGTSNYDVRSADRERFDAFLEKPASASQLSNAVRSVANRPAA